MKRVVVLVCLVLSVGLIRVDAQKVTCATCPIASVQQASHPLGNGAKKSGCHVGRKNGYPIPDPDCTPGAINPSITLNVLRNPDFKTGCVRDCMTTLGAKSKTYASYGIPHPSNNTGANQTCELDHLVSLELGGADTLDNIWPQCGPKNIALARRYFKIKDHVENYLAAQVKSGAIGLSEAQHGIAEDWTQYVTDANTWCKQPGHKC